MESSSKPKQQTRNTINSCKTILDTDVNKNPKHESIDSSTSNINSTSSLDSNECDSDRSSKVQTHALTSTLKKFAHLKSEDLRTTSQNGTLLVSN